MNMWHSSEGQIKNISQPSYLKCSACSLGYQENWTPTWIVVFRNGDKYHNGTRFLVSPAHQRNFDNLLESLTKRLEPSFGAVRQVYSPLSGTSVKCLRDLKPNHKYVVAGKERLQKISTGYMTLEEKFQKKLICKHKARNMLYYNEDYKRNKSFNDDYSNIPARYFVDAERLRKGMMTIFVHRNGDFDNRPIRFVLSEKDRSNLLWWGPTIRTIAQRLKSGSIRSFHTVDGEEVHTPCDLQNGQAYVVVGRMEKFVHVPYKSPDVVSFVCCQESEHIRHLDESMPEYCISHQIYTSESSGEDLNDKTMKTSSRATDQKEGTEYNKRWRESLNEEQNPNPKSYGCVYIPNLSQKHNEARKEEPRIINKKHSIKETKIIKEERKPQYDIKRNNYVPGVIENKQKSSQFDVKQNEEKENNESSRIQKIQPQGCSQVNKTIETKKEEELTQVEENKKESDIIDVKNEKEPKIEEKNKELKKTATKKCFNSPCIDGQKSSQCDNEQNKEDELNETDSKDIITQVEEEIQPCKSNDREGSNKGTEEIKWIIEEKTLSPKTKRCFSCPCFYRDKDTNRQDGSKDIGPQISEKNIESTGSNIKEDEKEMKNDNNNEGFEKNTKDNEKPKRKKCCNCLCIRGKKSSQLENEQTINCKNKKSSVEKQQQFEEKTKSESICFGSEEKNQEPKTNGSLKTETRDKANQTNIDGDYYLTSMKSCPKRSPNEPVSWNEFPQEKVHMRKTKNSDKVLIIYKQRGKLNTAPKKSFHSKRHGKRIVRGLHKNNHPRPLWTNRFKNSKKKHLRPLWRNCIKKPQLKRNESEKAKLQGPHSNYWVKNMRTKRRHKRCKIHNKRSEVCHHYHSEPYYVGYLNTHDTGRHDLKFQCSGSSESPIVMGDVLFFDEDPGDERLVAVYEANTLIESVNKNETPNDTMQLITRNENQILQVKPHDKLRSERLSNNNETDSTHPYDAENSKSSKIHKFVICKAYKYDILNEGSDASTKHDNDSKEYNNKKSPEIACPILFDENPQKQTEINEKAGGLRKSIKNSNMREDSDLESVCSDATFTMNLSNSMEDGKWEGEQVVQGKINQGSTNATYPSNKSELKVERNDQADKASDIIHSRQKYSCNKTVGKVEREKKTNPEIKMTPEDLALEQEYLNEEFEEYSGD